MENKQIKLGAVLSYVAIAVNILSGLIYTPWMVAQIGKGDYGLYTLANSLITLFLVDFGLSSAVSRYLSKYRAQNRQDKIDNFLGAVYKLYLIIDAVILTVLIVVYFFIDSIYVKLTPEELTKFKVVYIISGSFAVINFPFVTLNGILNSYEEFINLKLADVLYRIVLVAVTVVALLLGYGLYALVAVHVFAGLLIVAYKLAVIKKRIKIKINWKYSETSLYKDIFGFSAWVTVSSLAQRLIFNITPSILGIFTNSAAIAVFGIVTTIEGYAYTVSTAINGMFMPKISRIYEQENSNNKLMSLMLSVGKFQYAINGLIVAGFAVVGKSFINLWIGSSYSDAFYGILLVLIPGVFFNSLEIANTALIVEKKVNLQAYVYVGMGLINIILSFALAPKFGVIGVSFAIFVSYMVRTVALLIINKKVLKLDIIKFIKECYIKMGIPILITVAFGLIINRFVNDGGWLILLLKGMAVVVIYLFATFVIGLNKQEKDKLLKLGKRRY